MTAFCSDVVDRFGRLDIWVNNAGKSLRKPLMEVSAEEWDNCQNINLRSVFLCCKIAATQMKKNGGGVIVNASAFSGFFPTAGIGAYGIAKSGLNALTRLFAAELAPDNIRVVSYIPGMIATPLTAPRIARDRQYLEKQAAVRRLGIPDDIAPAVVFLSSDLAGYVTGTGLEITGGKFCVQNPMYAWQD
jgi:3-oxoacyl-[acyl-carrier protein] reductase